MSLDLNELADELDELNEKRLADDGEFNHDDQTRLMMLRRLEKKLGSLRTSAYDEPALISESEWEDYCKQLAIDCDFLPRGRNSSPLMAHINWSSWAEVVAQEYSTVELDGETFYHRDP